MQLEFLAFCDAVRKTQAQLSGGKAVAGHARGIFRGSAASNHGSTEIQRELIQLFQCADMQYRGALEHVGLHAVGQVQIIMGNLKPDVEVHSRIAIPSVRGGSVSGGDMRKGGGEQLHNAAILPPLSRKTEKLRVLREGLHRKLRS